MSRSPFRRLSSAQAATDALNRHHDPAFAVAHPQRIIEAIERERSATGKADSWLADHIVAIAGTMAFFHLLWATIAVWAVWQSGLLHNKGFDHFPYAFLFFMLGGIMQSLFVPTMLTASNRAAERDRIKDEADHRSLTHLYEVNEEQLRLLRALVQGQDGISEAVH